MRWNAPALAAKALEARKNAYCPYSGFAVGAALLCEDGEVVTGCNIESAALTGCCAERAALFKALSDGKREFAALAVAGGGAGEPPADFCPPCGVCRQVLSEFCGPDFPVILTNGKSQREYTLGELLPASFGKNHLA